MPSRNVDSTENTAKNMFQTKILTKPVRSVASVSTRVKFLSPTFSFQPCANASPWPSCGTHCRVPRRRTVLPVACRSACRCALS